MNDIEKRFKNIPVVEPDEWDLQMLAEIDAENDDGSEAITLEEMDRLRKKSDLLKRSRNKFLRPGQQKK